MQPLTDCLSAKWKIGHGCQFQKTREICFQSQTTHDGNQGKPRYYAILTRQQLQYFIHFGFKAPKLLQCYILRAFKFV